jgi:hypothetical protein
LGTAFICLLPSVQLTAFHFFAESILLGFVIGALYHLIKSDNLVQKKHTILFSICVIGAVWVRPVEALLAFILPFGWYLLFAFRQNKFIFKKILKVACIILLFTAIWYAPFYKQMYEWIYRTSFGDLAAVDPRPKMSLLYNFKFQVMTQGLVATIVVLLLLLFSAALDRFKNVWQKEFTYVLLLAPIAVVEVFLTIQNTPRKIAIAYTAFFIVALMIGLKKGRAWRLRAGIVTLLLIFQFAVAMLIASGGDASSKIVRYGMTGISPPSNLKVNPYDQLADYLIKESKRFHFKNLSLVIGELSDKPIIDPFTLITIMLAKNTGFYTGYSFFSTFGKDSIAHMNTFDALLIADRADRLFVSKDAASYYKKKLDNETSISDKTWDYFMYHYAANDLNKLGWTIGSCIDINSLYNNGPSRGCLLIRKH